VPLQLALLFRRGHRDPLVHLPDDLGPSGIVDVLGERLSRSIRQKSNRPATEAGTLMMAGLANVLMLDPVPL
jgi:hypothetical protein